MKYYKFWIVVVWLTVCTPVTANGSDLKVLSLKFYAHIKGDGVVYLDGKEIEVKKEGRLEFYEYDPLVGLDPDFIDIGVNVSNNGTQSMRDVEVRIAIAPKISHLIFIPGIVGSGTDPRTADHESTYRTASWFAPIILQRKTLLQITGGRSAEVRFEKINLKELIQGYVKRKLWPSEFRIEASIEPQGREDSFQNNTMSRNLGINLPPY